MRRAAARLWAFALAIGCLVAVQATGSAAAEGLLRPPAAEGGGVSAIAVPAPLGQVRTRIVEVDVDYLRRRLLVEGSADASDRVARSGALPGAVVLELFPDVVVTARRERVEAAYGGGVAWSGTVAGEPHSSVVLVADAQEWVTGYVLTRHRTFEIEPLGNGLHSVSEIDTRMLPEEGEVDPAPPRGGHAPLRRGDGRGTGAPPEIVIAAGRAKLVEQLNFTAPLGGKATPAKGQLRITGSGGAWQLLDVPSWIKPSRTSGNATSKGQKLVLRPVIKGMPAGIHTARLLIKVSGEKKIVVRIRLTITEPPPPPPPPPGSAIDVLFVFTPAAAASTANLAAKAQTAVTLANQAYDRGGLDLGLRIVGVDVAAGYDESVRTYHQVLYDATDGVGAFAAMHAQRDALGADLVATFTDKSEYCGVAWRPENPTPFTEYLGFSVTTQDCISGLTTHHEIGHNMGLKHDRFVSPWESNAVYNFGYSSLQGRWRTVMAYANECSDAGFWCTRINTFSSPNVFEGGLPAGIPQGQDGAADNVRRLSETMSAIAQYRPTIVPDEASPATVAALP